MGRIGGVTVISICAIQWINVDIVSIIYFFSCRSLRSHHYSQQHEYLKQVARHRHL